jgi:large subunit ribosomal protein L3
MKSINVWGKKVGMTQVFVGDKIVPVTAIDVGNWWITNVKTEERDGYNAVQIGLPRKRYQEQPFSADWLKNLKTYFGFVREIRLAEPKEMEIGQSADLTSLLAVGDELDIAGPNKGCGFQGVIKRHNFQGPPGSHGSTMGRAPGSMSFMRSRGRVIKGKRLPGHMGNEQVMVRKAELVQVEKEANLILVRGSVPGKTGTLVAIRKA